MTKITATDLKIAFFPPPLPLEKIGKDFLPQTNRRPIHNRVAATRRYPNGLALRAVETGTWKGDGSGVVSFAVAKSGFSRVGLTR